MTFKFLQILRCFTIRFANLLMWIHWALERWILGTDMGPLEGAPTIWIGVGLGHFPSPRGCSDDAWASSCFFFKGGEEFVVPRTGNEKCLNHGVLALIAQIYAVIEDPFDELKRSGPFWAGRRGKATMRFHQAQKDDEGCVSTAERYIIYLYILSSDTVLLHVMIISLLDLIKRHWGWWILSWEATPICSVVRLRERRSMVIKIPCCVSMRCWCLECHPVGYSLMTSYHHHNLNAATPTFARAALVRPFCATFLMLGNDAPSALNPTQS